MTTTTHLSDILDVGAANEAIRDGFISVTRHPSLPLKIMNYTPQAQFKQYWTNEVIQCRGLIVDDRGIIVARGPAKFFNVGQNGAPEVDLDTLVDVTRKEDGSLGIGYVYNGVYGVATRGSFTSEQAIKATSMLTDMEKSSIWYASGENHSANFEIIYPSNRIVLDYGDDETLLPLGQVSNDAGVFVSRSLRVMLDDTVFAPITYREALALPIPDDEEGYVIDILNDKDETVSHVKLKGEAYKRLHAIVTNTSARTIWTYLVGEKFRDTISAETPKIWGTLFKHDGDALASASLQTDWQEKLFDTVPDEFEAWVHSTITQLEQDAADYRHDAMILAHDAKERGLEGKELFEFVKHHPFQLEILHYVRKNDSSKIRARAWREVQPRGVTRPFATNED